MPIPSGFEHLNKAGEEQAMFAFPVSINDTLKVKASSRHQAERLLAQPLPTEFPKGGEK